MALGWLHMQRFSSIALLGFGLVLAACVDTAGLSRESTRPPRGNPNGIVIVTEFADLQCPSCRAAQTTVLNPLVEKYGSQVRFDFKHFPLRAAHRYALDLAEGAECAADQEKFWEFVDLAYEKQDQLGRNSVTDWAGALGLDMDLFRRCTKSHIKRETILADYDEGKAAGVGGTPTFFVNRQQTEAALEAMSRAIDEGISSATKRL